MAQKSNKSSEKKKKKEGKGTEIEKAIDIMDEVR